MKHAGLNKDSNYSLSISENYKEKLTCSVDEVLHNYTELIVEYFKMVVENIKITNQKLSKFIIIRGLDTITNVFLHLLYHTQNIELTYFHCQKAFYLYIEFVGQITDDEKIFLQLTSRDATIYVYKKTLFTIKNEATATKCREQLDIVQKYINIYQLYLLKIINSTNMEITDINYLVKIANKLNNIGNTNQICELERVVGKLYDIINDKCIFFKINQLLINKFIKNSKIITIVEKKINSDEILPDNFINWFLIVLKMEKAK